MKKKKKNIYIYGIYIYMVSTNLFLYNRTSCAQVHELP